MNFNSKKYRFSKPLIISIFLLCVSGPTLFGQSLYPIQENGKHGFIDCNGKVKIKPIFSMVGTFKYNLAPARLGGLCGYINKEGKFIIPPQFDIAFDFNHEQMALVYKDSTRKWIRPNGEFVKPPEELKKKRKPYASRTNYSEGFAIVEGKNHSKVNPEVGTINNRDELVISYGKFRVIMSFQNGYAQAWDLDGQHVIINTLGDIQFKVPDDHWRIFGEGNNFREGLIPVTNTEESSTDDWKYGYKNMKGEIVLTKDEWTGATPFHHGRAFVEIKDEWYLINKKGTILSEPFDEIITNSAVNEYEYLFYNNVAIVEKELDDNKDVLLLIDTNGKIVKTLLSFNPYKSRYDIMRDKNLLLLSKDVSTKQLGYSYTYSFLNLNNLFMLEVEYPALNLDLFAANMISYSKEGNMGYIDTLGNKIWESQGGDAKMKFNELNQNRAYCYANSPPLKKYAGYGGWGDSGNEYKKAKRRLLANRANLYLKINIKSAQIFQKNYLGYEMILVNASNDTAVLNAQDSRLNLLMQAQDQNGNWKDIEYNPSSWCGNSYHKLFLPARMYWQFTIPKYHGAFKTLIRAKLTYSKGGETFKVFSNEIEGSINKSQFFYKGQYHSSGLMDPYNE